MNDVMTYEGRKDIRSWKSDVADWYGAFSYERCSVILETA